MGVYIENRGCEGEGEARRISGGGSTGLLTKWGFPKRVEWAGVLAPLKAGGNETDPDLHRKVAARDCCRGEAGRQNVAPCRGLFPGDKELGLFWLTAGITGGF